MANYSMKFDDIVRLVSSGMVVQFNKRQKSNCPKAFRGGLYVGSPGKDVYFILPLLNNDEFDLLANLLSKCYPYYPPVCHVAYSACARYVYGCFDKQGCLCSPVHEKMMKDEMEDWTLSDSFMDRANHYFNINGCKYGQIIYNEMKGNRIGDRILISNRYDLKKEMIERFTLSQSLAVEIGSWKHTFTPFYWAARYLEKFDTELSIKYHIKNLMMMERYCPDTREGYKSKAIYSIRYLKTNLKDEEWKELQKWLKKCKNKCIIMIKKNGCL